MLQCTDCHKELVFYNRSPDESLCKSCHNIRLIALEDLYAEDKVILDSEAYSENLLNEERSYGNGK